MPSQPWGGSAPTTRVKGGRESLASSPATPTRAMSETETAAAAAATSTERKPRRLRGHKKGAVTCCVASSARPGVVASSGEVHASTRSEPLTFLQEKGYPRSMASRQHPVARGGRPRAAPSCGTMASLGGHWSNSSWALAVVTVSRCSPAAFL